MDKMKIVVYSGIRVLTTRQVAKAYEVTTKKISNNFNANKKRYVEGKHYICLSGEEKRQFINRPEFQDSSNRAKYLYLWTERGILLLAKSINTDTAWEAYERLVDFYFRAKENTEPVVRRKDSTSKKTEPAMKPQELSVEDVKRMGMNRGIVLGVYRAENKYTGDDIMEVYNLLSDKGKKLVQSLIFGEMRA